MPTVEERLEKVEQALEILAETEAHRIRSVKDTFEKLTAFLHPKKAVVITTIVTPEPETVELEKPPTNGKGSSIEVWKAYAESLGIEVGPDASKAALIEGVAEFEAQRSAEVERPDAGADVEVWRAYAEHLGIEIGADSTKDEIVAEVEHLEAKIAAEESR